MATNNSVKIKITGDSSDLKKELSSLGKDVQNFGTSASAIFKGIMASQIVTKGFSMLSSGLKSAINTGMNFEAQMSRVQAIAGATNEELDTLTAKAKELGQTSVFTAQEAAEGMENLASAGFEVQEIMDAMPGMLNLAASSGEDLASSAETTASILRAFGLDASEAGHVADVLATNAAKTNAAVADTGEAMKYVAPMANTMGLSMEECAAAIGILSDSGIKGSQAGTTLRSALSRLAKPTSAMQSVMKELGLEFYDSEGKMKSLSELVSMLQSSLSGLTQEEQQNALVTLFGQEAMSGMMVLMNSGSEKLSSLTQSYQECTGSAEEMANTMIDNLSGDVKLLESAFEALQITASESTNGMARSVVQMGTDLLTALNEAGKTGGLSGIADAFIEQIPELLPKITKGIESVLGSLGKKLPALMKNLVAQIPNVLKSASTLIPSLTNSLFSAASGAVSGLVAMLPELLPIITDGLVNFAGSVLSGVGDIVMGLFEGVEQAFHQGQEKIAGVWVDSGNVAKYKAGFEVEIDLSEANDDIDNAYDAIYTALNRSPLTDDQKAEILALIGSDYQTIYDKLIEFGLSPDEASELATNVTEAGDKIVEAYEGLNVGLDAETLARLTAQSKGSRIVMKGLLKDMGLSDGDIQEVIGVYDECMGTLKDGTPSIVSEIYDKFTDGEADSEETVSTLKEGVQSVVSGLVNDLQTWYDTELAKLDPTAADYAARKEALDTQYNDLSQQITSLNSNMTTLVDTYAGAATEVVEAHMDEFGAIEQRYMELDAAIDSLSSKVTSSGEAAFDVTRSGAKADEETIALAINYKATEYKVDEQAAEDTYNAALEELNQKLAKGQRNEEGGITIDEYNTQKAQLIAEKEAAIQTAQEQYQQALSEIFAGIAESEGNSEALTKAMNAVNAQQLIADYFENGLTGADGKVDQSKLSALTEAFGSVLGDAFNPEDLTQYIDENGKITDPEMFNMTLNNIANSIESASSDSITTALGGKLGEAYKAALKEGVLEGTTFDTDSQSEQLAAILSGIAQGASTTATPQIAAAMNGTISDVIAALNSDGALGEMFQQKMAEITNNKAYEDNVQLATNALNAQSLISDYFENGINGLDGTVDPSKLTALTESIGSVLGEAFNPETLTQYINENGEIIDPEMFNMTLNNLANSIQTAAEGTDIDLSALADKVESETSKVADAADIEDEIGDIFKNVGKAADSMNPELRSAVNTAISIVNSLPLALRKFLGIASPSRVMKEIGKFTGEGFGGGLEESLSNAVQTARSLMGDLTSATSINIRPSISSSDLNGSINDAFAGLADIENNRDIAMYVNGREFARATTKDYNSALNGYAKRIGLGYGRG